MSLSALLLAVLSILNKLVYAFDWCTLDSGYTTIVDGHGYAQVVYVSVTSDGAVWLRFGQDMSGQGWVYVDETRHRLQATLLSKADVAVIASLNYTAACALTDIELTLKERGSWHPSYLTIYDVTDRVTRTMNFKVHRDCQTSTVVSLSPSKQNVQCTGHVDRNLCNLRNLPPADRQTRPLFLTHVTADPSGVDHWSCWVDSGSNAYTFRGSFYYAYVQMALCPPPRESRVLGYEAKLRPHKDAEENTVIIGDPTQAALSGGTLTHWQLFVSVLSSDYDIYLQVWRPSSPGTSSSSSSNFTLVQQTYYRPTELRFQELALTPLSTGDDRGREESGGGQLRIEAGDVLGIYFPGHNPTCFTAVPCMSMGQHYRYYRPPVGQRPVLGRTYSFTTAPSGDTACRHYSFRAILGSKLDAKVVETWRCPDQRSHRVPDADGQELTISGNSPAYRKTIVDAKRSSGFVPPEAVASIQLLVIAVGCSILFIVIVCCFLYYRVKSR